MFRYLGVMPELATLLDQLIETTPPADDPTGRATFDSLHTWRLIRNLADHQIGTHAAQLDELGVAQKTGSTTKKLLIESGHAPAAALRTMRSVDALPNLPAVARHAADGRLSSEIVDAIVRGMNEIDRRCGEALSVDKRSRFEIELIAQALSGATPTEVLKHAQAIGNALGDACDAGTPASDDASLNSVSAHTTDDGRVEVRADLTQVVGEKFLAMIDERSCPRPEPDSTKDRRTAEQRRADAFELILDQAAIGATIDTVGSPRTQLMLTIPATGDLATLPWTGSVSQATAKQASCDGSLTPRGSLRSHLGEQGRLDAEGVPLQMGHTHRLFPAHLRKAMIVRDACCIKCGAPPSHTQVHHVTHWADGGATDLDNGCLLCQRCHTQVHHHGWDIVMGFDRHPWLVPPTSIDPHRRPLPAYNRRTMRLDDAA
ncbi:HNH endonuclease signature motif containing protein [Gordonia hongkongensis]|uniref:HNH endonuclease signature motif containing protein n=1 Tax=Gordonia hongkongensis TaxID=1701090 RepID=UPI001FFAFDF9|nr:HNH endonuclease signature motif containing protein [Gordonia hongkongensis]UPG66691.1 HNH endonuclease [Gordonia hongkongensis]